MKSFGLVSLALALVILCSVDGHELRIKNNCPFTVWIGLLNNPGKELPANGGFQLNNYNTRSVNVPYEWGGRVWARTNCDGSGKCETGDCGNRIECRGNGGRPPVSLAEFTFDGWGGNDKIDYYDVSLVDGYNLPVSITPIRGTYVVRDSNNRYDCTKAGCHSDLNARCPEELSVKNSGGWTVACLSACEKFQTDDYCCRRAHNTPETCKSSDWPKDYPKIFKQACPEAYSYAYDDQTSTFTCKSSYSGSSGYDVVFCP